MGRRVRQAVIGVLVCCTPVIAEDSGRILWRAPGSYHHSPPIVGDNILHLFYNSRKNVLSLHAISLGGENSWRVEWDTLSTVLPPAADDFPNLVVDHGAVAEDGSIYVPASLVSSNYSHSHVYLLAFDGKGSFKWKLALMPAGADSVRSHNEVWAVAVRPDGSIIAPVPSDSALWAINPDGQVSWRAKLGGIPKNILASSTPCIDETGTAYVGCSNGRICAVNAEGQVLWQLDLECAGVQNIILGPQGLLYAVVSGPDALVAVDRSGQEVWRYLVRKKVYEPYGSPVVDAMGNVVFTAYTGPEGEAPWLISLTPEGVDYWREPLSGIQYTGPLLVGDDETLYLPIQSSYQCDLLALDAVSGQERWSVPIANVQSTLTMSDKGVLYCANGVELVAIQTDSRGLADSPWPKAYRDQRNSSAAPARATAVLDEGSQSQPRKTTLLPNYPNPFNSGTAITFVLEDGGQVDLSIFDLLGQSVCQLVRDSLLPGTHTVLWDGRDEHGLEVSSGLYCYRLSIGRWNQTGNMVKVR